MNNSIIMIYPMMLMVIIILFKLGHNNHLIRKAYQDGLSVGRDEGAKQWECNIKRKADLAIADLVKKYLSLIVTVTTEESEIARLPTVVIQIAVHPLLEFHQRCTNTVNGDGYEKAKG
jgi:hypothetical protein